MGRALNEEMINKINEMFEEEEKETSKQKEIDELKSLKEFLEKSFPVEESIKKGK